MFVDLVGRLGRHAIENRKSWSYLAALLLCAVMGALGASTGDTSDAGAFMRLLVLAGGAVFAAMFVSFAASRLGRRPEIPGAMAAGLGFALTLSLDTAAVPAAIAMAVGWVVSQEVFGSRERSFVHPAVLAYVFLALTWPQALGSSRLWLPASDAGALAWTDIHSLQGHVGGLGASSALACLVGALILLAAGRIPWRILAAVPLGMAAGLGLLGTIAAPGLPLDLPSHLLMGNALFGVVFLATDPAASPGSKSGQWAHGVIVGFLIVLQRLAKPTSPDGTVFALLVASVFAPLLDRLAAAGQARWPRDEHG